MINDKLCSGKVSAIEQRLLEDANESFYQNVVWALDIANAEFDEFTLRARIPVELIRRDPLDQARISRQSALRGDWRSVDLKDTWFAVAIEDFLKIGLPETVLVAPRKSKKFPAFLKALERLRDAGVVDVD